MNDYLKDNFEQNNANPIENRNLKNDKNDGKEEINKMNSNPINNSKGKSGKVMLRQLQTKLIMLKVKVRTMLNLHQKVQQVLITLKTLMKLTKVESSI